MPFADSGQALAAIVLAAVSVWIIVQAGHRISKALRVQVTSKLGWLNLGLNSPVKRLGACFVAAGMFAVVVGALQIAMDASSLGSALRVFFRSAMWVVTDDRYSDFKAVSYGVPVIIFGLAFSLFYDLGVGRLIRWIQYGEIHQREQKT